VAETFYAGGFVYTKTQATTVLEDFDFYFTPEGYAKKENGVLSYVYQYKDHLGNVRLSYKDNNGVLEIIEENNYYPFGLKHEGYNNVVSSGGNSTAQKYQYNGKEWQDELGLNVTAMDFRQYDAAIGRFNGMDRLAELAYSITPYRFAFNNPNYWADPTGLFENDGGNDIARCDKCPKTVDYLDKILDPFINYDYDEETGLVTPIIELNEVVVEPSKKDSNTNSSSSSWWSSLFFFHNGFELWGQNKNGDLGGNKRGNIKHSIVNTDIPIMGNGKITRAKGPFNIMKWLLINYFKNRKDGASKIDRIYKIIENTNTSTVEVQNVESVAPPPQAVEVTMDAFSYSVQLNPYYKVDTISIKIKISGERVNQRVDSLINRNKQLRQNAQYWIDNLN
jgi:RHS repeat-associated protein